MKPKIFMRTDGDVLIGLGHVMRCIALAQMLKSYFEVSFFCRFIPENVEYLLAENNFQLFKISHEHEFVEAVAFDTVVVLDGYKFDSEYQSAIKAKGVILVCIDDLHDKIFFADLIINHSPSARVQDYHAQVYTHYALGADYVLLRSPFLEEAKKDRRITKIDSVLICFGGSDPNNLTEQTLQVVMAHPAFKKIVVVVGSMYRQRHSLEIIANRDSRITLHINVDAKKMVKLFLLSALAIVPASGILMEAITAGNCIISGTYVENQRFVYEAYREKGLFIDAGSFGGEEIRKALEIAVNNPAGSKKIIDGNSPLRLLRRFRQLQVGTALVLRNASETDLETTYRWATDRQIRFFSFQKGPISWEEHQDWFLRKLIDERCIYYIVQLHQEIIGSVRFDVENEGAIISYLIDPRFHSMGYGLPVLSKSFEYLLREIGVRGNKVKYLVGYVMNNNYPSIKTFLNLGFREYRESEKLKFVKSVYGDNKN